MPRRKNKTGLYVRVRKNAAVRYPTNAANSPVASRRVGRSTSPEAAAICWTDFTTTKQSVNQHAYPTTPSSPKQLTNELCAAMPPLNSPQRMKPKPNNGFDLSIWIPNPHSMTRPDAEPSTYAPRARSGPNRAIADNNVTTMATRTIMFLAENQVYAMNMAQKPM